MVLFSMAVAAQDVQPSASRGKIQGVVADVTKGGIPAVVNVIRTDTGAVVARLRADRTGAFQTEGLNPGSYAVTAWDPGFRRRDLAGIMVRKGEITDVGGVQLDLANCDAPSINCDEVFTDTGSGKSSKSLVARGSLRINSGCGADLEDHGKQYCSEPPKSRPSKKIDVLLAHDGNDLYLIAANGATMSMPNSSRADCGGAKYGEVRVRVNGLGPGVDLCVHGKRGSVTQLFFVDDIDRNMSGINLWYVTRKN